MIKLLSLIFFLNTFVASAFAISDIDCQSKNTNKQLISKSWVNEIQRISFFSLCQSPSIEKIPAHYREEMRRYLEAREKFYAALSEIGNETDGGDINLDIKQRLMALSREKMGAEISLFAKINGLENVLNTQSPMRMRIVKFPGFARDSRNYADPQTKAVAENPYPGDADWANFSLQNGLQQTAELEVYLEDNNGQLHLFKTHASQGIVGTPGPKIREGDFQVPEGEFNVDPPMLSSQRLIALGIDANPRRIPGRGSNIKIHGSGPSEGCVVVSNPAVVELAGMMSLAKKKNGNGGPGANVLITPFRMDQENYKAFLQNMNEDTKLAWAKEIANHPELKNYNSLEEFWDNLAQKNEKFKPCRTSSDQNCVSRNDRSTPSEISCLDHAAFGTKTYISSLYQGLANRSKKQFNLSKATVKTENKKPDRAVSSHKSQPESDTKVVEAPSKPAEVVPPLKCKQGTELRYRVDYYIPPPVSSMGSTVFKAANDQEANERAKKEFSKASKLEVKAFCMILSADEIYRLK